MLQPRHALCIVHEQGHLGAVVPGQSVDDVNARIDLSAAVQASRIGDTAHGHIAAVLQATVDLIFEQPETHQGKPAVDALLNEFGLIAHEFFAEKQHLIDLVQLI